MNDWLRGGAWSAVLLVGLGAVTFFHRAGMPRTYARDLLHVGAGVWVVGWPWWMGRTVPLLLVWGAFVATALVPIVSPRLGAIRRLHDSIAGEGERWAGIVAYTGSFAVLTTLALAFRFIPAAVSAAAAMCAGDGLGGLIGRRFGRHRYALPWSKAKTWEGSAAVLVFSALGIALVLHLLSLPLRWETVLILSAVSAVAEALAPRASDNAVVPAAVLAAGLLLG